MPWNNGPLTVYHGCDDSSASSIAQLGIQLRHCKPRTDFGVGFYTTTNLHQAKNWANDRVTTLNTSGGRNVATVLSFAIDRGLLGVCLSLSFVTEGSAPISDFWDLIRHCRHGGVHFPALGKNYDVVFGPVSLWPQTLLIKDCDQISFHTITGTNLLGPVLGTEIPNNSAACFP